METTYTSARPVPNPLSYKLMAIFNDAEVLELYPGALGEVFELRRDEQAKLNLLAEAKYYNMNVPILVGIIAGGMLGALASRIERAASPATHLIIGSIAGATIGGLTLPLIINDKS